MKSRRGAGRSFFVFWVLGILLGMMFWGVTGTAAEESAQESGNVNLFDIEALLLSSNGRTYDIQVTVSNQEGDDWEGAVRMWIQDGYGGEECAYDTVLSLPQGSTKQFVVRIPKESVVYLSGTVYVSMLDKRSEIVTQRAFKRLLLQDTDMLPTGILSDSYQSLTYLDLGGETIYYGGNDRPVRLIELDTANLDSVLDSLVYLVIDNYNTDTLTDEMVDRIEQWVNDGGMLLVATGTRAEDTLGGLDFLELQCLGIEEAGEGSYSIDYAADLQIPKANLLDPKGQYYVRNDSLLMLAAWGNGAVEVIPYALSDLGQLIVGNWENWEDSARQFFYYAGGYAQVQKDLGNEQYEEYFHVLYRIFRLFGNGGSRLNFGGLKWIVVLYVIFVGPVLYLILRALKKRDWYWIAVPVTALVGIFLVYCAGSGFEVANTRVFSVTVENLTDQNADAVTYMHCYDAGHKEWGLQMADRYAYAGSLFAGYYGGEGKAHVRREGERLDLGLNPSEGFEDCHFIAGTARKLAEGSITSDLQIFEDRAAGTDKLTGTVTNDTDYDFKYFAILYRDILYVYGELPAGETCDLDQTDYLGVHYGYGYAAEAYLQGYMDDVFYSKEDNKKEKRDIDIIAALGTGIAAVNYVEEPDSVVVIGVTEDWYKVVDDDCTETSYGCLYAVQ